MRNVSILEMYKTIFAINKSFVYNDKRLIVQVKDAKKLDDLYSYDFIVPEHDFENFFEDILNDLNVKSDYVGVIQKRKIKHLNLVRIGTNDKLKTKGKKSIDVVDEKRLRQMRNIPFSHVVSVLNQLQGINLPIVDKTNYFLNVDIDLPEKYEGLSKLRQCLRSYGLDLLESEEPLPVFVLSDDDL